VCEILTQPAAFMFFYVTHGVKSRNSIIFYYKKIIFGPTLHPGDFFMLTECAIEILCYAALTVTME
jgi:hypothetical protein